MGQHAEYRNLVNYVSDFILSYDEQEHQRASLAYVRFSAKEFAANNIGKKCDNTRPVCGAAESG